MLDWLRLRLAGEPTFLQMWGLNNFSVYTADEFRYWLQISLEVYPDPLDAQLVFELNHWFEYVIQIEE